MKAIGKAIGVVTRAPTWVGRQEHERSCGARQGPAQASDLQDARAVRSQSRCRWPARRYTSLGSASDAPRAKNVVLCIGDGMGFGVLQLARNVLLGPDGRFVFEAFPNVALVTTHALNNVVTDSAAAGTAIATGHKTNNGMISVLPDGKFTPESIRKVFEEFAGVKDLRDDEIQLVQSMSGQAPYKVRVCSGRGPGSEAQHGNSGNSVAAGPAQEPHRRPHWEPGPAVRVWTGRRRVLWYHGQHRDRGQDR